MEEYLSSGAVTKNIATAKIVRAVMMGVDGTGKVVDLR